MGKSSKATRVLVRKLNACTDESIAIAHPSQCSSEAARTASASAAAANVLSAASSCAHHNAPQDLDPRCDRGGQLLAAAEGGQEEEEEGE